MFIKWVAKVFSAINSNTKSSQIAAGIAFAFILALIPKANILWIVLFVLTFFLKINQSVEIVFIAVFDLVALFFDVILDKIGYAILTISALEDFFTVLFNSPFFYFTRYYNTIVMGGLIVGIILCFPVYFLAKYLVDKYRDRIRESIAHNKIIRAILKQPLISNFRRKFSSAVQFYNSIR